MLKRILVGFGDTDYTVAAINQAVALAPAHNAEVTGVTIIDKKCLSYVGPLPPGGGRYAHELVDDRMTRAKERVDWAMQEFTEACSTSCVQHRLPCEVVAPFSLTIDHARYHDLMIFGLRSLFEFDLVPDPHDALVRLVETGVRPLFLAP